MAAGFEQGLEETEAKSVVPEDTSLADAQSLAQDTEVITKKIGFETPVSIGSVREVDSAIASIFNLSDVQITPEGVLFPEAFKLRALAIKEIARDLQQTGKYGDVTSLIGAAANKFEQQHFSKLPIAFRDYKRRSSVEQPVRVNATGIKAPNTDDMIVGQGFMAVFGSYADNPATTDVKESLTYIDQIILKIK